MRRQPSLRPLLTAALLVPALTLAACGEDEPAPRATPDATASSRSAEHPAGHQEGKEKKEKPDEEAGEEAGATLSITVSGDDVSPMGRTIELAAGDPLTIEVSSDRTGELHVHASPEKYVEFGSGRTRRTITLAQPGQVDVEEHDTGALVARLLVK